MAQKLLCFKSTKTLIGDFMPGFYLLCALLIAALIIDQETTVRVLTAAALKIQIYYINLRLKFMAWRMYRALVKLSKEAGYPAPGPFVFVDIWDREPLD